MVHKGLAGWLTSGDYSIRGDKRVYQVKLHTRRLPGTDPLGAHLDYFRMADDSAAQGAGSAIDLPLKGTYHFRQWLLPSNPWADGFPLLHTAQNRRWGHGCCV
jgi:hypothetical protein